MGKSVLGVVGQGIGFALVTDMDNAPLTVKTRINEIAFMSELLVIAILFNGLD